MATDWGTTDQCPLCGASLAHDRVASERLYYRILSEQMKRRLTAGEIAIAEAEADFAVKKQQGLTA